MAIFVFVVSALGVALAVFWLLLRLRNMDVWFWSYLAWAWRRRPAANGTQHVYVCLADHYEPYWHKATTEQARARVARWLEHYPVCADRHTDSDGRHPQHTFFYPEEEYDPVIMQQLVDLCRRGYGDIEVHLHHDNDNADNLARLLNNYTRKLADEYGMLHRDPGSNKPVYAFIHGNWALDNSHPEGRWCGVDDELSVLKATGCYADLTMPSAPSRTQTRKVNSIYFAHGRPGQRKAHDSGEDVAVGRWRDDALLMIQGPLTLNWQQRKWGFLPKLENAEISHNAPPSPARVALWERCAIGVKDAPSHLFVKLHTHGTVDPTSDMFFGGGLERLWSALEQRFKRPGYRLHYVSAWEMYAKIRELAAAKV